MEHADEPTKKQYPVMTFMIYDAQKIQIQETREILEICIDDVKMWSESNGNIPNTPFEINLYR